jgi:hypothetical protein
VPPYKGDGLGGRDSVKHRQARQDCASAAPAPAAGNLDSLSHGALMQVAYRLGRVVEVSR